jgi:hypothetical protein
MRLSCYFIAMWGSRFVNGSRSCFLFREWTIVRGKRQVNHTQAFSRRYEHRAPMFLLLR